MRDAGNGPGMNQQGRWGWLDPGNATQARLLAGIEAAAERGGDEIACRRTWTRVATPEPVLIFARPRVSLFWGLTSAAACAVVIAVLWSGQLNKQVSKQFGMIGRHAAPVAPVAKSLPAVEPVPPRAAVSLVVGPATVRTSSGERRTIILRGGAQIALEGNSVLAVDAGERPRVEKGRMNLSVPHQKPGEHFAVAAGSYVITVIGTRFQVRVVGESVGVDVDEGVVEIWRGDRQVRLKAGDSWSSPSGPSSSSWVRPVSLAMVESAPAAGALSQAAAADPFREAQAAVADGEPHRALDILSKLARGSGPTAENAAYEVGRLLRDHLLRPRQAIEVWKRYGERHPRGLLRAETDLSIVETLVSLGDEPAALTEADAFLARYPQSERRAEVERLVQRLRSNDSVRSR